MVRALLTCSLLAGAVLALQDHFGDGKMQWTPSAAKKVVDGVTDEALLQYRGEWSVEESTVWQGIVGDYGLVAKTAAAHHAISKSLDKPFKTDKEPLVFQYSVKFQNVLECGGAYVKLLSASKGFEPKTFGDKTPYTIMFGPDKCGGNNKVHFIFRHLNPKTGEFEEKHLNNAPEAILNKKSNLYTLIVNTDNTFKILINNEPVRNGSLLNDFTPSVNPPKEIDDVEDKKPADWVDEAKIPDPSATKPEDWDEDAPLEIPDLDAKQPNDWLTNEPDTIPDPQANKPDDWDDDEDGEWVAPLIPNPKCAQVSGCGEWKRPSKKNPAYKGKWSAPLIDNPKYKGPWAPRKIPNPNYFEDKNPHNFTPIGAVGIEIWTIQNDIVFDDFILTHKESEAKEAALKTWKPKFDAEAKYEAEEKKKEEDLKQALKDKNKQPENVREQFEQALVKIRAAALEVVQQIGLLLAKAQEDPVAAVKTYPYAASTLVFTLLTILLSLNMLFSSKPVAKPVKVSKPKVEESDNENKTEVNEDEPQEKPNRRTRKKEDNE